MTGAPVPPAHSPLPAFDEPLRTAIAIVECSDAEDAEGLSALTDSATDPWPIVAALAGIITELTCPGCIESGEFRAAALEQCGHER